MFFNPNLFDKIVWNRGNANKSVNMLNMLLVFIFGIQFLFWRSDLNVMLRHFFEYRLLPLKRWFLYYIFSKGKPKIVHSASMYCYIISWLSCPSKFTRCRFFNSRSIHLSWRFVYLPFVAFLKCVGIEEYRAIMNFTISSYNVNVRSFHVVI